MAVKSKAFKQTHTSATGVRGKKYPRGFREWYFPHDNKPETAIEMAILDYKRGLLQWTEHYTKN